MIGETKTIKEKHTTISIICLNSTVLIYQFRKNMPVMVFIETHRMCFFHFKAQMWQRTTTAMRISGFQHLWRFRSCSEKTLRRSAFFYTTRYPKVMKFTSVGNLSFFLKVDPVDLFFLLIYIFIYFYKARYASSSCSLQLPGRDFRILGDLMRCILQPFTDPFRSDESRGQAQKNKPQPPCFFPKMKFAPTLPSPKSSKIPFFW